MSIAQLLEENIEKNVHNIPAPAKQWVRVEVKDGKTYVFDMNDAPAALCVVKIIKENKEVKITKLEKLL